MFIIHIILFNVNQRFNMDSFGVFAVKSTPPPLTVVHRHQINRMQKRSEVGADFF